MKRVFVCLFVVLSLMLAPVMQAQALTDPHRHAHDMDAGEHASLDVDSEGNPHDGDGHFHFNQHSQGEFYRAFSEMHLTVPVALSQTVGFRQDRLCSDYCPGPLLEPPSLA
jgi:hypothetical protein